MQTHLLRAGIIGVAVSCLSGCLITPGPPPGEPVYEPPAVVVEPPVSSWFWVPWPHYEVEHHYVIENEHVYIRDRHYFPSYGNARPYIRNDNGRHTGWYKHERR
jgi:hypothetical protein